MRIVCHAQKTSDGIPLSEWMHARAGKVTASRIGEAMAKLTRASKNGVKGDWKGSHWDYVSELAWEIITGQPAEHYVSKPMEIGSMYEKDAAIEYWMRYGGDEPDEIGLVLHPRLDYLAASPDRLVGADGLVEIKVPTFGMHCSYLESGEIPEDYQLQMQCQMLCCERPWNDFISYCPPDVSEELPNEFRMFRKRLEFDPSQAAEIEEAATATIEHVIERVNKLRAMYPSKGAPKSKFRAELETAVLAQEAAGDPEDFTGEGYAILDRNELERVP